MEDFVLVSSVDVLCELFHCGDLSTENVVTLKATRTPGSWLCINYFQLFDCLSIIYVNTDLFSFAFDKMIKM